MGDTRNRGKILWFLITARPDLLPIDLKRQGRAEEHIPLFYPETVGRVRRDLPGDAEEARAQDRRSTTSRRWRRRERSLGLSGSDLEAVLVRAILEAEAAGARARSRAEHLKRAFADFIPPTNSLEREMQILCARARVHQPRAPAAQVPRHGPRRDPGAGRRDPAAVATVLKRSLPEGAPKDRFGGTGRRRRPAWRSNPRRFAP